MSKIPNYHHYSAFLYAHYIENFLLLQKIELITMNLAEESIITPSKFFHFYMIYIVHSQTRTHPLIDSS